jgi:hypothetical protein
VVSAAPQSQRAASTGLHDLLSLARDADGLVADIESRIVRRSAVARLASAERVVKEAAGRVLDGRFASMGGAIEQWWNSLRPGELVGFGGTKRRAGGALYVNLVAVLRADSVAAVIERDALAPTQPTPPNHTLTIYRSVTPLGGTLSSLRSHVQVRFELLSGFGG